MLERKENPFCLDCNCLSESPLTRPETVFFPPLTFSNEDINHERERSRMFSFAFDLAQGNFPPSLGLFRAGREQRECSPGWTISPSLCAVCLESWGPWMWVPIFPHPPHSDQPCEQECNNKTSELSCSCSGAGGGFFVFVFLFFLFFLMT